MLEVRDVLKSSKLSPSYPTHVMHVAHYTLPSDTNFAQFGRDLGRSHPGR